MLAKTNLKDSQNRSKEQSNPKKDTVKIEPEHIKYKTRIQPGNSQDTVRTQPGQV